MLRQRLSFLTDLCYNDFVYGDLMEIFDAALESVWINVSSRTITLVSDLGETRKVEWKWDQEGSEGFSETVDMISSMLDPEMITYTFATHD